MIRDAIQYDFFVNTEGELFHKGSARPLPADYETTAQEQWLLGKLKELGGVMGQYAWGRFRVYGGLHRHAEENFLHAEIVLVTEFCTDSDDKQFWDQLTHLARHTGAGWWTMDSKRKDRGNGDVRVVDQVELSWRVEALPKEVFAQLYLYLRSQTEKLWQRAGVGVC